MVYELFKETHAGPDVFKSLALLFNGIKEEIVVPQFFHFMGITSLYKIKVLEVIFQTKEEYLIFQK